MPQSYFLSEDRAEYEERILAAFTENEFTRLTEHAEHAEDIFHVSTDIARKREALASLFASLEEYYTDKTVPKERMYAPSLAAHPVPYSVYRAQMAFLIATRAYGTFEEIAAALLLPLCEAPAGTFRYTLSKEDLEEAYGSGMAELFGAEKSASTCEECCERIDNRIFRHAAERLFEHLTRHVRSELGGENAVHVKHAYEKVLALHGDVKRRSGEPYIFHPLSVALLLLGYKVNAETLAAALLHDTIEQTDYTLSDVGRDFTENIRDYVGAVTHISSMKSDISPLSGREIITSGAEGELEKIYADALRQSIESRPSLIAGLYIKAADRLVNLRTLDALDRTAKYTKISQTKEIYLPLFRSFRLEDLSYAIESEILKIEEPTRYHAIHNAYRKLVHRNSIEFTSFFDALKTAVGALRGHGFSVDYRTADYSVKELIEILDAYKERSSFAKEAYFERMGFTESERKSYETPITKRTVMLKKLYLILTPKTDSPEENIGKFMRLFMDAYAAELSPAFLIEDIRYDSPLGQYRLLFADAYENRVELFVTTLKSYMYARFGESLSDSSVLLDERKMIRVTTDAGDVYSLPVGATALDLSFAVSSKAALTTYRISVNGKEVPFSHKLQAGDSVSVVYTAGGNAPPLPRARLGWFADVETNKSRDALIRYFEKLLSGDALCAETVIRNDIFAATAASVYENADGYLKKLN